MGSSWAGREESRGGFSRRVDQAQGRSLMDEKPTLDYQPSQPRTIWRDVDRVLSIIFGSFVCLLGVIPLIVAAMSTYLLIFTNLQTRDRPGAIFYTVCWWLCAVGLGWLGVRLITRAK
jgi:hypothetical protein